MKKGHYTVFNICESSELEVSFINDHVPAALTTAVLGIEVFIDGVERILLFAAMLSGSQDISDTLVQEGVLTLEHT